MFFKRVNGKCQMKCKIMPPTFLLFLLLLPSLLFAAPKNKTKGGNVKKRQSFPSELKIVKDVVYKEVKGQVLDMYLFLPLKKVYEKTPVVMYIHGGGWGGGDKFRARKPGIIGVIKELNNNGVLCASIEYRLTDYKAGNNAYDSIVDCKDAIRFLVKNKEKYNIDVNKIATFGSSAGGHLTLATAFGLNKDFPGDKELLEYDSKVCCVAAYYPLCSFYHPEAVKGTNFERPNRLRPILGGLLEEKKELAQKISPIDMVTKNSPPSLILHGKVDTILPYQGSVLMKKKADEVGAELSLVIVEGAGHGFKGDSISPTLKEIIKTVSDFFLDHFK